LGVRGRYEWFNAPVARRTGAAMCYRPEPGEQQRWAGEYMRGGVPTGPVRTPTGHWRVARGADASQPVEGRPDLKHHLGAGMRGRITQPGRYRESAGERP
jgi:hypothetical protein